MTIIITIMNDQMKREKAVKRKEALEHAKREEEEARLAEVTITVVITIIYVIIIITMTIITMTICIGIINPKVEGLVDTLVT